VPRDAPTALTVAAIVAHFSGIMGIFVALLGLTGVMMGWMILGSLDALLNTNYGRVLIVKVIVVIIAVAIGGWNRFRLVPAVATELNQGGPWRRLQRAMTAEAFLIAAVLLITGVLVNQNPVLASPGNLSPGAPALPATPAPTALDIMVMGGLGDVSLHGELAPGTVGENTLTFGLHDEHDMPVETISPPTVSLSLPSHDLGPLQFEAAPKNEPGSYQAQVNVPLSGEWELTISARVSRFEEPSTTLTVTIP
jgi:copper transport protein